MNFLHLPDHKSAVPCGLAQVFITRRHFSHHLDLGLPSRPRRLTDLIPQSLEALLVVKVLLL